MDVGARITQLRAIYGMSQYALWKRSGIAQGALSQYESGLKTPGVDTIERICDALGISLADFFAIEPHQSNPSPLSPEELELVTCYRLLTPPQQQDALVVFRALAKKGCP